MIIEEQIGRFSLEVGEKLDKDGIFAYEIHTKQKVIKADELRIGSLVLYNSKEIAVSPVAIYELYYLGDSHANSELDKREYLPIPITEEFILKFGFEKIGYTRFVKKDFPLHLWFSPTNLYYALTGEELNQ